MTLIYLCMAIVFGCLFFLLLYRKIIVHTWARAWSCFVLLGIVGIYFDPKFSLLANTFIWVGMAGLHIYLTVLAYRRGYI